MGDNNVASIVGRLAQDPNLREAGQSGISVCDVTVANNLFGKGGRKDTSYIKCTVWDKQAEWIGQNVKKGDTVSVNGQLVSDDYERTKGDPSTRTSGRLKLDSCNIQLVHRGPNNQAEVPEEAPAPEAVAEQAPVVDNAQAQG